MNVQWHATYLHYSVLFKNFTQHSATDKKQTLFTNQRLIEMKYLQYCPWLASMISYRSLVWRVICPKSHLSEMGCADSEISSWT